MFSVNWGNLLIRLYKLADVSASEATIFPKRCLATRRRQSGKSSASADFRVRILDQCAQTPSYSKTNDDFKSFLFFRKQGERLVTIVC